jgi:uncharacterized protein (TIGR02145 family)
MKKLFFFLNISILLAGCNPVNCGNGVQDGDETGVDCGGGCPPCQTTPSNSVTDADGNVYPTVIIGTQEWMAENLKTTKYCNGDSIPNVADDITFDTGAWVNYQNDIQYEEKYGKLYNWYAVNDSRNVCPCGWHVPTDAEWTTLTDYLGGEEVAGAKMKSSSTMDWPSQLTGTATNESGFSALPGGYGTEGGSFNSAWTGGWWWSSTENTPVNAFHRELYYQVSDVQRYISNKGTLQSIRCIKD